MARLSTNVMGILSKHFKTKLLAARARGIKKPPTFPPPHLGGRDGGGCQWFRGGPPEQNRRACPEVSRRSCPERSDRTRYDRSNASRAATCLPDRRGRGGGELQFKKFYLLISFNSTILLFDSNKRKRGFPHLFPELRLVWI